MRIVIALAVLAGTSACSEPAETVPEIENAAPVADRTPIAPPPTAASSTPVPVVATLPQPLLGAWTADTTGDCTGDNELRIDIAADRIDYHESRATITSVTQVDPHSWGIDAELSGEGEGWKKSFDLNLNEDGTLTRVEAPIPDIVYSRCPAGTTP